MFKTIKRRFLRNLFIAATALITCLSLANIILRQNQIPQESTINYQSENNSKAENGNSESPVGLPADYKTNLITDDSNSSDSAPAAAQQTDEQTKAKLLETYGQLPLHFEPNNGQIDNSQVRFSSRGQGYNLFLSPTKATLALRQAVNDKTKQPQNKKADLIAQIQSRRVKAENQKYKQAVVEMQIVGANKQAQSSGTEALEGKSNYFIGNDKSKWKTDVANYKRVRFDEVYEGINLEYYGNQRQLEYDFVVAPNADASQIKLKFRGVKKVAVEKQSGELILETSVGEVRQKKPFVYQTGENGERREVASKYKVKGKEVSFELGEYDRTKQLTIDPVVLSYSSFLGGSTFDHATTIEVDNQGNAYVAGYTESRNFLVTPMPGAYQTTYGGGQFDAFVSKFNAAGSELLYSTYLGGSGEEYEFGPLGLAFDADGNAYIAGTTNSPNFPRMGALQNNYGGGATDVFITKINSTGSQLVYSTFVGSEGFDLVRHIKVDTANNLYFVGNALQSPEAPVLSTPGVYQKNINGSWDAYIGKINPAGSRLEYFTYLGGSHSDFGYGIAIDNGGNAYVAGETCGPAEVGSNDFPTTMGVVQKSSPGDCDAFVTKINATATAPLIYSTFYGGKRLNDIVGYDYAWDIAIDSSNNAYITGGTSSPDLILEKPIQQPSLGGGADIFDTYIAKLNPTATALIYATYIGGTGNDFGTSIAVDNSGNAHITGDTNSLNFPQVESRQKNFGGAVDAFILKLNADGSQILYSTYHGGSNEDRSYGIAVDNAGNAYIAGDTRSDKNFPLVNSLPTSIFKGDSDAFVSKFSDPPSQNYSVAGRVKNNSNEVGAGGVIIKLDGAVTAQTTTNAEGFYTFNNLPSGGTYVIKPVLSDVSFPQPLSRTIVNLNSNFTDIDFLFTVCTYSLSPVGTTSPVSASGASGSFNVTTICPRTATSNASWLIVTSGVRGNGSGQVSYVVQRNYGQARSGTITVNGQNFTVTQEELAARNAPESVEQCAISFRNPISLQNQSRIVVPATPEEGITNYSFTIVTPAGCQWTAVPVPPLALNPVTNVLEPDAPWITIEAGSTADTGEQVARFRVPVYDDGNIPRSAEIAVNGEIFTVIQTPKISQDCPFTITQINSPDFSSAAAESSFMISGLASVCKWVTFVPNQPKDEWIKLLEGFDVGTNLTTTAKFKIEANQGAKSRIGTIIAGDKAYMVTQAKGEQSDCDYQLSSLDQTVAATVGATGSFTVSAGNGCSFDASTTTPWLKITGGSGSGSGTISFETTSANTGTKSRPGTITVEGKTFTVKQNASQQTCSYSIDPGFRNISEAGGAGIVTVTATSGCGYTAVSSAVWLSVSSGATGNSGNSQVSYIVEPNNTTTARTGTIAVAVAGQTFTVNQAAGNGSQALITVGTNVAGLSFTVDGTLYTSQQQFSWQPGSQHTISTTSPQSGTPGTRYIFGNWSDGGAISHSVTASASTTNYTANFTTQYQLTMNAGAGGNANPPTGNWYNAGQSVQITATPNSGFSFNGWTGSGSGSYTGANNPATVTMNSPVTETANFTQNTVPITITTNPVGRSMTVDGATSASPQTFNWLPGSTHTVSLPTPQSGTTGTQFVFTGWSDGNNTQNPRTITAPTTAATYTANFTTQHQLTMSANPTNGGTINPPSGWRNAGESIQISTTANNGFTFNGWTGTGSGSYTGANSSQTITMNGPITQTANFTQNPTNISVTVGTNPTGRSFTVDGTPYTSQQQFSWQPGSQHIISTTPSQDGTPGTRYIFGNWSDGGAISHTVTASASTTTYTANFTTQYQLTTNANPANGGSVSTNPSSVGGWYDAGQNVQITAAPSSSFTFNNWTGSSSSTTNPLNVTMNAPINQTANFRTGNVQRRADFDGDGKTDLSIFRPAVGEWWYLRSSDGGNRTFQFGNSSDRLVPADYTGDGRTDVAVFRPSTNEWFILRSEDNSFFSFPFGTNGDIPAPADFDGDGKADAAVFRPSNNTWFISRSSGGTTIEQFGISGDVPVTADYDGDGKSDIAIYRPSLGQWWLSRSSLGVIVYQFGSSTDKPVQGDYTGDGKVDVAFFRPSTNEWFILRSEDNSFYSFPFGTAGDVPSPGDYDGDGKADAAIFRPSNNTWFAQRSTSGTLIQGFGIAGDKPIPNAFVP